MATASSVFSITAMFTMLPETELGMFPEVTFEPVGLYSEESAAECIKSSDGGGASKTISGDGSIMGCSGMGRTCSTVGSGGGGGS